MFQAMAELTETPETLLALRRRLKTLSAPSDRAGLLHLAGHLALLGVTSAAVLLGYWWLGWLI